jgi:hypothetical protein
LQNDNKEAESLSMLTPSGTRDLDVVGDDDDDEDEEEEDDLARI